MELKKHITDEKTGISYTICGDYVTVKCRGGLKVTRENERISPYRT